MPRKEHIISKTEPLPPFSENLVFYAPLSSEHGFKDLISGTVGTVASTGYAQWDSTKEMYHLRVQGGSSSYAKGLCWDVNIPLNSTYNEFTLYCFIDEIDSELNGNGYAAMFYAGYSNTPFSGPGWGYICNAHSTNRGNWQTKIHNGKVCATFSNTGGSSSQVGRIYNYLNGVQKRTANWTCPTSLSFVEACGLNGNNSKYGCYIKDLRIYNRVLSASEVAQL